VRDGKAVAAGREQPVLREEASYVAIFSPEGKIFAGLMGDGRRNGFMPTIRSTPRADQLGNQSGLIRRNGPPADRFMTRRAPGGAAPHA
jgi:hypothetical protein